MGIMKRVRNNGMNGATSPSSSYVPLVPPGPIDNHILQSNYIDARDCFAYI
jgi:hypothetical protein